MRGKEEINCLLFGSLCSDLHLPGGVGRDTRITTREREDSHSDSHLLIRRKKILEIIKSFSSSDHYTPLHYTELAVVSVDNFPSELLADFPAAGWLRPCEPEVRWESGGLSWEAKPPVLVAARDHSWGGRAGPGILREIIGNQRRIFTSQIRPN